MLADRHAHLISLLQRHGLDALIAIAGPNLRYLTGLSFHLSERPVLAAFTPEGPAHLALPGFEHSKAEGAEVELVLHDYGEDDASRANAVQQLAAELGLGGHRVGVEPLRMRVGELRLLEAAAPDATFVSAEALLTGLRAVKEEAELGAMRAAVEAAERALDATLEHVREGMTENELASELALQLLRAGSQAEAPFTPIVAFGANSALPHAVPTERRLRPDDLVLLDWGASVGGYVSDLTRCFAFGEIIPELRKIHAIVQEANRAGRAAARPGAACADVDKAARRVIEAAGYGDRFPHRTGHGLGLEGHEPPYLRGDNDEPLEAGMTFTVEPGIYLQGLGGVRVEDDVVVTPQGSETLSRYPRDLRTVG